MSNTPSYLCSMSDWILSDGQLTNIENVTYFPISHIIHIEAIRFVVIGIESLPVYLAIVILYHWYKDIHPLNLI